MEFKTQKEVDDYIVSLGVFLNKGELCMKTNDGDYIIVDDKKAKIIDYVERNTSPLSEIKIVFPTINLDVFDDYTGREQNIEQYKKYLSQIKDSKKFLKNGWRLIRLKKKTSVEKEYVEFLIYDYNSKSYNPIKDEFLDSKEKEKAYELPNISILNKLQKENFENQYKQAYKIEMGKWDDIPVYDVGGLNE